MTPLLRATLGDSGAFVVLVYICFCAVLHGVFMIIGTMSVAGKE